MHRTALLGLAAVALFAPAAQAHWWDTFWLEYHRVKHWPQPFVQQDAADVLMPLAIMEAKGWQRENLLGQHHFDAETGELTEAGRLKVHWILTQAPPSRRTVYVQRGMAPGVTAVRMLSAKQFAANFAPNGLANVQESNLIAEGWPADLVDQTNTQFRESRPAPILPAATPGE